LIWITNDDVWSVTTIPLRWRTIGRDGAAAFWFRKER